jgi:hypothetical protein
VAIDAIATLSKVGCKLIAQGGPSPDDQFVLARRDVSTFPERPYVTWAIGDRGLFWGHYDLTEDQGWEDFHRRRRGVT